MPDIDHEGISISDSLKFALLVAFECGIGALLNTKSGIGALLDIKTGWLSSGYSIVFLLIVFLITLIIIVYKGTNYLLSEIRSVRSRVYQFFIYVWLFGSGYASWRIEDKYHLDPGLQYVAVTIIAITSLVLLFHSGIMDGVFDSNSKPDDEWIEIHKDGRVLTGKRKYKK